MENIKNHIKIILLSLIFGVGAAVLGMGLTGALIEPYVTEMNQHLENANQQDDPLSNTKIKSMEKEEISSNAWFLPVFAFVYGLSFIPILFFRKELRIQKAEITSRFENTWLLGIGLFCFTVGFLFISTISDVINSHEEVVMSGKMLLISELKIDSEKYALELNNYSSNVRSSIFVNSWYAAHSFGIGILSLLGLVICKFTRHEHYGIVFGGGALTGLVLLILLMRFFADT